MKELKPIRESTEDYDKIEKRILAVFKRDFFLPILKILGKKPKTLQNAISGALEQAIVSGKVFYAYGHFQGLFNAQISLELKEMGAKWDRSKKSFALELDKVPISTKLALSIAKVVSDEKLKAIASFADRLDTELLSEKVQVADLFDKNLFKVEKEFQKSISKITVAPELPAEQRERIATEWQENLQLDVKKFSDEQVIKLRQMVHENIFTLGNRREALHSPIEDMLKSIQKDWPHVQKKAKFLAQQETNLAMAKYKQTRYEAAGVKKYKWTCVHMPHQASPTTEPKKGDVRYSHWILNGKVFSWSDPPITTPPVDTAGNPVPQRRNNPGQDYRCRCYAIPVLE